MARIERVLVTCEHGGNGVPSEYRSLFEPRARALGTHRGHDPGALELARRLSRELSAPLKFSTTTRLLVDLNRSPHHRRLFSEFTRPLDPGQRARLLGRHYYPYRRRIETALARRLSRGRSVLHLSVHSFTPVLRGRVRRADIGLLYDPDRGPELAFCLRWQRILKRSQPRLRIRRNYPYRGRGDGLVAYLRRRFPTPLYLGVELEVNQTHPRGSVRRWRRIQALIAASCKAALAP